MAANSKSAYSSTLGIPDYDLRENWNLSASRIYALSLLKLPSSQKMLSQSAENAAVFGAIPLSQSANTFMSKDEVVFSFRHNPQSLTQDMPPAVTIQPTFGGMFIEHQGQPFSNITISGTFGIRPVPIKQQTVILGVTLPSLFSGGADVDVRTGLPVGETTGFNDMYNLRYLFSEYFYAKVGGEQVVMVWTNAKNGDAYVVEPIGSGLTISRDKSSPMSASYQITLRAVASIEAYMDNIVSRRKTTPSFIQKITKLSSQLSETANFITSFSSQLSGTVKGVTNTFLGLATDAVGALTSVATGFTTVLNIPKDVIKAALATARRAIDQFDAIIIAARETNRLHSWDAYARDGISTQIADIKNAYAKAHRALDAIATENALFANDSQVPFGRTISVYPNPTSSVAASVANADVINQRAPSGAANAYIRPFDTIRSIALRYVGDATQWHVIARMNNLQAPYISPSGDGQSVLRPGQLIRVPAAGDAGQTPSISPAAQQYPFRPGATAFDDVLGVDAKLQETGGQGTMESYDLVLNETGDVARVRGQANMNQAIALKFATENGELPLHPEFGVAVAVGSRIRNSTFGAINFTARAALLADPRITGIQGLSITLDGSTLNYTGSVQLAGGAGSLSLNYVLR